jgi:DNA-binding NtrC family response regulator
MLTTAQLPAKFAASTGTAQPPETAIGNLLTLTLGSTVDEAEKALIEFTLGHMNNNKTQAAKVLGISLKTLHCKIKRYKSLTQAAGV